jgi:hypothetical protein
VKTKGQSVQRRIVRKAPPELSVENSQPPRLTQSITVADLALRRQQRFDRRTTFRTKLWIAKKHVQKLEIPFCEVAQLLMVLSFHRLCVDILSPKSNAIKHSYAYARFLQPFASFVIL